MGNNYTGYIDEIRISNVIKDLNYLQKNLFVSIDDGNDSSSVSEAVYNFDGYLTASADAAPKLNFRNSADFSHSATQPNRPVSPLIRNSDFPSAFYLNREFAKIPEAAGSDGYTYGTVNVLEVDSVSDINVYVSLNHTNDSSLKIVLFSPDNDSCVLFNQNALAYETDNIITIFDDQADSSISNQNRYVSIAPKIRSLNNLNSAFSNTKTNGVWRLRVYDKYLGDIGKLYCWGIQINNHSAKRMSVSIQSFMQGLYNPVSNETIRDTLTCALRNSFFPYSLVAKVKGFMNTNGWTYFDFSNTPVVCSVNYFIQMNHRNSIEVWGANTGAIDNFSGYLSYSFPYSSTYTYGYNVIQIDNSPYVTFGFYSGDVNQDGTIDAGDLSQVENDASVSLSGYEPSDVTGDDFVDAGDLSIVENNSALGVSAVIP